MNKLSKPAVWVPALLGIVIACLFLFLGEADDSPGLGGIGLIAGFLLIMYGIYNSGIINKRFIAPVILICFGCGGILFSTVLFIDGEYNEPYYVFFIGLAISVAFLIAGVLILRKYKKPSH